MALGYLSRGPTQGHGYLKPGRSESEGLTARQKAEDFVVELRDFINSIDEFAGTNAMEVACFFFFF